MASNTTSLYSSNYPSSSPYTLKAEVVENSHNDVANTSNVTITASITSGGVYYSGYSTPKLQVQYKDNNAQSTYVTKAEEQISSITSGTPSKSVTWTGDVVHKNDGTLSVTVKAAWVYKDSGTGYAPKSGEVEVSLTMTTIPRAGTVSISPASGTIATTNNTTVFTATVTPQSSSYYHHISATCNGTSCMTAVWAEDNSNKGYIKDTNLLTALGNNLTGTVTVTVKTYTTKSTSSTLIGTNTASANVTVNTSVIKPSLTSTSIAIKTTPITSNLVAGYSTANVKFTVAGGSGTTSCNTTVTLSKGSMATATASGTGSKTLATNVLSSSTSDYTLTATITATDGRGATASTTVTATVKGYSKPSITVSAYRVDANGSTTADEAGPYVYITYSATAKSIGNNSIQSLTATYTGSISGTLSASPSWLALSEAQGITITVTATDRVDTISATRSVAVATFPLDLYQSGGIVGVGLGKVASANLVDSGLNMRIEKPDASLSRIQIANSLASVDVEAAASGNSGMWSNTGGYWIIYRDTSGGVSIPAGAAGIGLGGSAVNGQTTSYQNLFVQRSDASNTYLRVQNSVARLNIETSANGESGMWSGTHSHWIVHNDANGRAYVNGNPIYYTAGDTITNNNARMATGFITSSSSDLVIALPLAMPIVGATSAAFASAPNVSIRTAAGGYLQYYDGATYANMFNTALMYDSITITVLTDQLYMTIKCNSKWGLGGATVTNNSLVTVQFGTFTINLS